MDLILDPNDPINLDFAPFCVEDLDFQLAKKRPDWITGEGADGAALLDDPNVEVLVIEAKIRVDEKMDRDDGVAELRRLLAKVDDIEKRRPDGMELQWTDRGSSVTTSFYALMGEFYDLPMDTQGEDLGWYHKAPVIHLRLTCKPFGYGASTSRTLHDSDPFSRDTLSEGRWRFDGGSGTLSVSGGQLVPSSVADKVLYRPIKVADATATFKFRTTAVFTSAFVAPLLKRTATNTFVQVSWSQSVGALRIFKVVGGVYTALATGSAAALANNTDYWIRLQAVGNVLTGSLYTADPESGAAAVSSVSHTLAGGDIAAFGSGVYGNPGMEVLPGDTSWRYDDWLLSSASIRSGEPILDFEVRATPGDVDAEPLLTVTEKSTQNRRHFEWGLEHEDYDKSTPQSPLIDSDQMTALGGTATTRTGAYDPLAAGNSVIRATLTTVPLAICSTGNQGHIGRFRPKVRVYGTSANQIYVRFSYRIGDGPWGSNPWRLVPAANDFSEIDLGAIDTRRVSGGTQRWEGRIEAYSVRADGTLDTLDIDYLIVNPAKRWSKARAPFGGLPLPTSFSARDEFNQSAGALTGKVAPVGGTWTAFGGDTDDWAMETTGKTARRTSNGDTAMPNSAQVGRAISLGTTAYAVIAASIDFRHSSGTYGSTASGHLLRAVDTSNYLFILLDQSGAYPAIEVRKVVAAAETVLLTKTVAFTHGSWYTLTVSLDAAGNWAVWLAPKDAQRGPTVAVGSDTVLATGGALATGKVGIFDADLVGASVTRDYDNYAVWVPELPVVLNSTRTLEVSHERTERYDSTAVYLGEVPENPGSRLWLPPTGDRDLASRIVTKLRRNDVDVEADSTVSDEHEVALASRSRYRFPKDS